MQSTTQPAVEHSIVSAGVDWLTATASKGSSRWDMQTYSDNQRRRLMDSQETIKNGYRLGFYGWQCEGFFYGTREGCSIVVASGAVAHNVFRAVAGIADNISRLDLQVTVATPTELPRLGLQAFAAIKSGAPARRKVKNVTLIDSHPQGETCSIGRRKSDQYGRIYDKATESGEGMPRSVWRYEIELKRHSALATSTALRGSEAMESDALGLVHAWFDTRGVAPIFTPDQLFCPQKPLPTVANRDLLTWFEKTLSITVARAVRRYGAERVLEALGLLSQVELIPKEEQINASRRRRHTPADSVLHVQRPEHAAQLLGEDEAGRP
jgi:hypothetical protein